MNAIEEIIVTLKDSGLCSRCEIYRSKDETDRLGQIAIKVLETRIPKKVKRNMYNIGFCPSCHGSLWQNSNESNFCFRCGQAIDWSDNE